MAVLDINKTLLAFDTTGKGTSLSLFYRQRFYESFLPEGGSQLQSAELLPALIKLCQDAACSLSDISCLIACCGPGSFTGIRIGLSAVIGLRLVLNCQVFCPSSLHIMAFKASQWGADYQQYLAVIDTQRGDFYTLLTDQNYPEIDSVQLLTGEEIASLQAQHANLLVVGNKGSNPFIHEISVTARDFIDYYLSMPQTHQRWAEPSPFYVRDPQFVKKKRYQDDSAS
jgi:tRNA threonylcarbamoyladenosine biosynthesis protein TsaB